MAGAGAAGLFHLMGTNVTVNTINAFNGAPLTDDIQIVPGVGECSDARRI